MTSLYSSRAEASRSPADSCAEKARSRRAGRAGACACATERLRLETRGSPEPRRRRTVRRSGAGQRGRADWATRKPKEYAGDAHCDVGKLAGRPKRAEDGRSYCPRAAMVRRLDDVEERWSRCSLPWGSSWRPPIGPAGVERDESEGQRPTAASVPGRRRWLVPEHGGAARDRQQEACGGQSCCPAARTCA